MRHGPRQLTTALAATMAAQAALGLAIPSAYRDADWIKATWFGNDWVTLIVAVPVLLVARAMAGRGSTRGLLLHAGVLGYAAYNYAYYLFGAAFNAFFPLYVLAFVSAIVTLTIAVSHIEIQRIATQFLVAAPVKIVASYFVFIGAGLGVAWLAMWWAFVFAGRPTPIAPEAFRLVAALDLALMVTPLVASGVLMWRRRPWGFLIAAVTGVQSSLYLLVLSVNSYVAIRRGLAVAPGELPIWGTLALVTGAMTGWLFRQCADSARPLSSAVGRGSSGPRETRA